MPSRSKAQQRLMAAAEHGATFPAAKAIRRSMTREQMREYAETPRKGLPEHVTRKAPVEHEAHAYDWRSRNNLKRGRG